MADPVESARPAGEAFEVVARVDDLPEGTLLGVETTRGDRVCLLNVQGVIRAVRDVCTHQAFPMSAGEILPDGTLECAWHGARFDCANGAVRRGPAEEPLVTYDVRVANGDVLVGPPRAPQG